MNNFFKTFRRSRSQRKRKDRENALRTRIFLAEMRYRNTVVHETRPGIGNDRPESITLSLTSHGPRIDSVFLTIESLMEQSLRADRIVLNLGRDEFNERSLPETLKKQRERGLEIHFCSDDLGPYTKFYDTLKRFPDDLVITVDDDFIYPVELVDQLYRSYLEKPQAIHCTRGHKMRFQPSGELKPYSEWDWGHRDFEPSKLVFPTGVGGVLYFPGCFSPEVFNRDAFMKLAPRADDVWLKAMSLLNKVPCRQVADWRAWHERFIQIDSSQVVSLKRRNKQSRLGNDHHIRMVFGQYNLFDGLAP